MKKTVKICVTVLCLFVAFVLVDSAIALVFNNSPLLRIREYYDVGLLHYCDKGFLCDTYYSVNGENATVIKGFSYSFTYGDEDDENKKSTETTPASEENFIIVDKTKEGPCGLLCAIECFYEDDEYVYSYPYIMSNYIVVRYKDGTEETAEDALKGGRISISDLDRFDIKYGKSKK